MLLILLFFCLFLPSSLSLLVSISAIFISEKHLSSRYQEKLKVEHILSVWSRHQREIRHACSEFLFIPLHSC